jgi:pyrrolysine biosynthesis protein PylC
MQVAIAGGKLQGIEAAYLAKKAGWRTLLIDLNPCVPASGLCDRTVNLDVRNTEVLSLQLEGVDLIIPAMEDRESLAALKSTAYRCKKAMAFDPCAYAISSSKARSNELFQKMGLSTPAPFSGYDYPIVVKPDGASGSAGVAVITNAHFFEKRFGGNGLPDGWVAQSYVSGPSYSIEVIGIPGQYITPQVTDLRMDAVFDCKGVTAPSDLPDDLYFELERIAVRIANEIKLYGIMDVEVILNEGELKVIEIDARLPSQTPITVYWSTGLNMLSLLKNIFVNSPMPAESSTLSNRPTWLEHIKISGDELWISGEHMISQAGPLTIQPDFFGAEEAITDYRPDSDNWVATLIHTAATPDQLVSKRAQTIENIRRELGLLHVVDSSPVMLRADERETA